MIKTMNAFLLFILSASLQMQSSLSVADTAFALGHRASQGDSTAIAQFQPAVQKRLSEEEKKEIFNRNEIPIFDTTIRSATVLGRSLQSHKCIGAYEPSSAAAGDFRRLAEEIKARIAERKAV